METKEIIATMDKTPVVEKSNPVKIQEFSLNKRYANNVMGMRMYSGNKEYIIHTHAYSYLMVQNNNKEVEYITINNEKYTVNSGISIIGILEPNKKLKVKCVETLMILYFNIY